MSRLTWLVVATLLVNAAFGDDLRLHYRPASHRLGDVHPYFHDNECWLYSLKPDTYAVTVARSRDLIHWQEETLTYNLAADNLDYRPFYVLGVIHDPAAQLYRSYYGRQGRMLNTWSTDLLHWQRGPQELDVPAVANVVRRRDPYVFWIPEERQYGCVMTTQLANLPQERAGAISLATSTDLKNWHDHGPVLTTGTDEPECPQMFRFGDRWYLLASIYERAVGRPSYWVGDSPRGPWKADEVQYLEGKDLCAGQVAFLNDQPHLLGWIPEEPARPGQQLWGGALALPRELIQLENGRLGVKLAKPLRGHHDQLNWTKKLAQISQLQGVALELEFSLPENGSRTITFGPGHRVLIEPHRLQFADAQGDVWSELSLVPPVIGPVKILLIVEEGIAELFVNDQYALVVRLPAPTANWDSRQMVTTGDAYRIATWPLAQ